MLGVVLTLRGDNDFI